MNLSDIFKGTHELTKSGRDDSIIIACNCLDIRMKKKEEDYQIPFVTSIDENEEFIYVNHILPSDIAPDSETLVDCTYTGYVKLAPTRYRISIQTTVISKNSILAMSVYSQDKPLPRQITIPELYSILTNGPSNGFDRV